MGIDMCFDSPTFIDFETFLPGFPIRKEDLISIPQVAKSFGCNTSVISDRARIGRIPILWLEGQTHPQIPEAILSDDEGRKFSMTELSGIGALFRYPEFIENDERNRRNFDVPYGVTRASLFTSKLA